MIHFLMFLQNTGFLMFFQIGYVIQIGWYTETINLPEF